MVNMTSYSKMMLTVCRLQRYQYDLVLNQDLRLVIWKQHQILSLGTFAW